MNPLSFLFVQTDQGTADSAVTDVRQASQAIQIQAGRNGLGASASGNGCGPTPKYAMGGQQDVIVEAISEFVHLVANPVAVHANQQVTFTATREDGQPPNVYSWHWQPDAGQPGSATNPCWSNNPCVFSVAALGPARAKVRGTKAVSSE